MVVPAVGIVIRNHHCGTTPGGQAFQEVDRVHDESLLVKRVGISGVAVLITRSLKEAHGRKIASGSGGVEILDIVLVVGPALMSDFRQGNRTGMSGIGGRRPVSEQGMVRDVVGFCYSRDCRGRGT